ncbi:MAG: MFS transporter [Acidobacteriota bacterium]|nr:MFS transporter [Acidobacteriota bacterium]
MAEKLNKSLLYTFGVGDLFFTLLTNMEIFFFTAFLTDYARFSLVVVGQILWITGVADIVCALAAGVILQRATLQFGGRYRSWLVVAPPLIAPLFILQFTRIGGVWVAASIVIVGFIASHLLWNVVFAATGALVGTLSKLPEERTILSSSRAQGISAAGLIFSATALPMIQFFSSAASDLLGYALTAGVYAILMIGGYLYVYKITAGKSGDSGSGLPAEKMEQRQSIRNIVSLVFRNPPLLILVIAETFRNAGLFIITAFAFYYFGYVLKNPSFLSVFILAISVAALLGTVAAAWIGVRIGKRHAYWLCLILAAAFFMLAKFTGGTTWGFTLAFCLAYMLGMMAGAFSTALFADTVIYGEWKTGKNIQAFTMALLTLPIKIGVLIRSGVVTIGLMAIGFIANTDPAPNVVDGIRSIMIFAPAGACIIATVFFYFGYKIEDRHILQMQEEIAAR